MTVNLQNMDEHYSCFFQNEIPNPWPNAPMPMAERATPTVRSTSNSRSRLTLVACLSLVAAGAIGIVQLPQPNSIKNMASESIDNPLSGATADGKGVLEPALKEPVKGK